MKKLTLLLGLVVVAGTAVAQQDSGTSTKDKGTALEPALITESKVEAKAEDKSDKKKEASVKGAEVVSVDASSKTITVKEAISVSTTTPGTMTLSVQGKAVSALKDIKIGDFVDLTCKADNKTADVSATASGTTAAPLSQCASVTAITKAPGSALSSTSPSPIISSPSLGSPGGSMTADSSTSSTSSSIAQGGTLNPDQSTVDAEVKARASQPSAPATSSSSTTVSTSTKSSAKLTAVVVSTDPASKTITVRNPGQGKSTASASESTVDSLTLPVEGKAGSKLADFKAGDRVAITCRESATSSSTASSMPGSSSAVDTVWSSASRCAAVTEIAKVKASASEADPASSKAKSSTEPAPQPKTY